MIYAYYKTKLGFIKFSYEDLIKKIELVDKVSTNDEKSEITDRVFFEIEEYLENKRKIFTSYELLDTSLSPFQKKVLSELRKIPYGKTSTYKKLSEKIARPRAYRPVARSLATNPFFIIYPCHRVKKSDGSLGGFAYGEKVKEYLLNLEKGGK